MLVSQGKVKPIKAKVEAIKKFPTPQSEKELQRFLGMAADITESSVPTFQIMLVLWHISSQKTQNTYGKSYRPVANIKFIVKIIEKAASSQVIQHVNDHNPGEMFQSAYKAHHSTETALLQVKNNILNMRKENESKENKMKKKRTKQNKQQTNIQ